MLDWFLRFPNRIRRFRQIVRYTLEHRYRRVLRIRNRRRKHTRRRIRSPLDHSILRNLRRNILRLQCMLLVIPHASIISHMFIANFEWFRRSMRYTQSDDLCLYL